MFVNLALCDASELEHVKLLRVPPSYLAFNRARYLCDEHNFRAVVATAAMCASRGGCM